MHISYSDQEEEEEIKTYARTHSKSSLVNESIIYRESVMMIIKFTFSLNSAFVYT